MKNKLSIDDIKTLYQKIESIVNEVSSQKDIDRLLHCNYKKKTIELFSINFFEIDFRSLDNLQEMLTDKLFFSDLIGQAKEIAIDEKENDNKRAEALVRTYQLLEIEYILAPKLLEYAFKLIPNMPLALVNMGIHYTHIKEIESAFMYLNKAIEVDPLYPYTWLIKGNIEVYDEKRLYYYSEFIKRKPESKTGYYKRIAELEKQFYEIETNRKWKINKKIIKQLIEDNAKLINLNIFDRYFNDCISRIQKVFSELPKENRIDLFEEIIKEITINTTSYWIAQIIYNKISNYNNNQDIEMEIYDKIINTKDIKERLKMYCYYERSQIYFLKEEYEKSLNDKMMLLNLCSIISDKNLHINECDQYRIRKECIDILKRAKEFNKIIIDEYSKIIEELSGNILEKYLITDTYMERAKYLLENNKIQEALIDCSEVIEHGSNGIEYTIKDAYASRIKIYKKTGEMNKAFEDYLIFSEIEENYDQDLVAEDFIPPPPYEIIE